MFNLALFLKKKFFNEESALRFPIFVRFKHFEDFSAVNFPSLKLLSLRELTPICCPLLSAREVS